MNTSIISSTLEYLKDYVTYVGYHACSTIDLVLASEIVFMQSQMIRYLSVENLNIFPDYNPNLLCLNAISRSYL